MSVQVATASFLPIRTRLDWADLQIEKLHARTLTWSGKQNMTLQHKHDVNTGIYTFWITGFKEPPVKWGIAVGDVAHNLRAALDNTVYQLAILNGVTPPPENRLHFPITSQPGNWKPQGGSNLIGVAQKCIVAIEKLQPFHFNDRPHALEVLAALNDIDKHRGVHSVVAHIPEWRPTLVRSVPSSFVQWQRNISDGSVDQTQIRYRVDPPHARLEFNADSGIPIRIKFGQRGSYITIGELATVSQEVRRIISRLAKIVGESIEDSP